jgi:hypothetical protein
VIRRRIGKREAPNPEPPPQELYFVPVEVELLKVEQIDPLAGHQPFESQD